MEATFVFGLRLQEAAPCAAPLAGLWFEASTWQQIALKGREALLAV